VVISTSSPVIAQNRYQLSGSSSMIISGGSNTHDWTEEVQNMSGTATISTDGKSTFNLTQLQFKAEVKSIKSTKGIIMDNKTYDALNADKHPYITFDLVNVKSITAVSGGFLLTTQGVLSINGVQKRMDMDVKARIHSNGTISFEGNKSLNMGDFGVEPPTAMMGAMKVKDMIRIDFKVTYQ
ncbi:MAG: YceI family protein, partial [Chitinophagales bacterium]